MSTDKAMVTYATLREANIARQQEWDAGNQITLAYRGNELAGEVGEACNIIKKLERERLGIRGSRATREQLAEELADIVICTDLVAMSEEIDLDAAVAAKFNATSEKVGLSTRLSAALAQAEQPVAVPEGWQIVPKEPTDRMIAAGIMAYDGKCESSYRAMLAAALAHPPAKREAGETAAPDTPAPESQTLVTLADCPIGLFHYDGELCLKTEYGSNEGRIDAYIVSSGEFFWGGTNTPAAQRKVMVEPVSEIAVSPAPHVNVEPAEIPGELEMFEGKLTKVVDASRTGWWRFHAHRDRDGYCDNPARGY